MRGSALCSMVIKEEARKDYTRGGRREEGVNGEGSADLFS